MGAFGDGLLSALGWKPVVALARRRANRSRADARRSRVPRNVTPQAARTARRHASSFTPMTSSHRMNGIDATAAVASSRSEAYAGARMRRNVCATNAQGADATRKYKMGLAP